MRGLVDLALGLDPRIKRIKQEEKEAREAKRRAGAPGAPAKKTKAQEEEEKKVAEAAAAAAEEAEKVCGLQVVCGVGARVLMRFFIGYPRGGKEAEGSGGDGGEEGAPPAARGGRGGCWCCVRRVRCVGWVGCADACVVRRREKDRCVYGSLRGSAAVAHAQYMLSLFSVAGNVYCAPQPSFVFCALLRKPKIVN